MEALITTTIVGIAAIALGAALLNIRLNRTTRLEAAAAFLAQAGIEGIRSLPFSAVADQTDGPFRNVLFQNGSWTVGSNGSALSSPNILQLQPTAGTDITNLAIVPVGAGVRDGTITGSFRVPAGSPANWQVGFLFHAEDREHAYALWLSNTHVKVQKRVGATVTDVFSQAQAHAQNVWHKLSVTTTGTNIAVRVNDILVTISPVTDSTYAAGGVAVVAYNGTSAHVDNLSVAQTSTESWNFDSGEIAGQTPVGWERFGVADLPSGQALLTIADAVVGNSDIKQVTARVRWTVDGKTQERTAISLVGKGGVGQ